MSKSCTILAHVRRPNGEIVESRLFKDLLHYTSNNRELAKEYYAVGTSEEFLSKAREFQEFQTDENGEITFSALRTIAKMDIESDKLIQVLNKDIGEGEYDYDEALRRIENFNAKNTFSDQVIATMFPTASGKYYVTVVPQTRTVTDQRGKEEVEGNTINERKKLHDVVHNEELERKLKALLRSHGVSVKFLEGNRKEGRYSTENAVRMEDGLYGLIELSKEGYTTEAFAEEAGHFAVGALGDNPLVQRLEKLLESPNAQKEALGEEEYNNANLGNNPKREVAGRLVGRALQRKLDSSSPARVLANRIANIAKRIFYRFTGNEVRWAAAKAEQIANRIAYGFVEGDNSFSVENAISIPETMNHCALGINQQIYKKTMDELGRMVKQLQAIASDELSGKTMASLGLTALSGTDLRADTSSLQMDSATNIAAEKLAFDGIVQGFVQLMDYLGPNQEIDALMDAVNFNNPSDFYSRMAQNGRKLRQARVFLKSAKVIIETIDASLLDTHRGGRLKVIEGTSIHDVRYQDENGVWHAIDLAKALTQYKNIVVQKTSRLTSLESAYFARFCEDMYGSKYVTSTVGITWQNIWNGEEALGEQSQAIADLVDGVGMEDIDVFHRYLGSMSNNPDMIGQIVDKIVKTANKVADDKAVEFKDRLLLLQKRAQAMGLKTADLLEKDENGLPTGNLITPPASYTKEGNREEDFIYNAYMEELGYSPAVNNGAWEAAKEKFEEELWEEFKNDHPDWMNMAGIQRGLKWDQFKRPKMKEWHSKNSLRVEVLDSKTGEIDYVKWVPNGIYISDQWDALKAKYPNKVGDDSLERWLYDYREIKETLDSMLPKGATVSYRLPQFKGTLMNSVRQQMDMEGGKFKKFNAYRKTWGRRLFLESFSETAEDEDYGSLHTMNSVNDELLGTKLDYESERPARLPIFGINKLKNLQDLDSDIVGSLIGYAAMATSYKSLESVVDALEVGRETMYNRDIEGKSNAIDKAATKIGSQWRKYSGVHEVYQYGNKNRAYGRYIKFLEKQVYGISATHAGINLFNRRWMVNKIIQNISSLGGTMFLKGNILGGAVNTLTGTFNVFKEAVVSEHFDAKDWAAAHRYYFAHFPEMWSSDLASLQKNNKLSMFLEKVNAQNDLRGKLRNWHTNRTRLNNFYRLLGYLPYSSGDHYMQAMSYLAVAHGTQLFNTDGSKADNLWNAFKKVDNYDSELKLKKGSKLEFARMCPLNAASITNDEINRSGVYLKKPVKSSKGFESWLAFYHPEFVDDTYKRDHVYEYNDFRKEYNKLSDKELMQFVSAKYQMLASILRKVEEYVSGSSPLMAVPTFSAEELEYLKQNGVGTGNYSDILQTVRESIYQLIWTRADESAYMDKCREINNRLHGIYNQQDKTAWHNNWFGNAFLAMKGWALGYLEYLYSPAHYSIALGKEVEGFVNTAGKVLAAGISKSNSLSYKDMAITMMAPWSNRSKKAMIDAGFTPEQNYNARRMFASCFLMLSLWALKLATAPPDDDDEVKDATTGLVYYLAMRTLLEQQALIWLPEMYRETGQLADISPVGASALYDLGLLFYQIGGASVTDVDNSEFYYQRNDKNERYEKYDPKFESHFIRLVPYWKSWWALQHPYEAAENYQFGRKLRTR